MKNSKKPKTYEDQLKLLEDKKHELRKQQESNSMFVRMYIPDWTRVFTHCLFLVLFLGLTITTLLLQVWYLIAFPSLLFVLSLSSLIVSSIKYGENKQKFEYESEKNNEVFAKIEIEISKIDHQIDIIKHKMIHKEIGYPTLEPFSEKPKVEIIPLNKRS